MIVAMSTANRAGLHVSAAALKPCGGNNVESNKFPARAAQDSPICSLLSDGVRLILDQHRGTLSGTYIRSMRHPRAGNSAA